MSDQQHETTRCKWNCDDGWHREPDGYGCVQWTLCGPCNGTGRQKNADDSVADTEQKPAKIEKTGGTF